MLLSRHVPTAVLIDRQQQVLFIAGPTEDFLALPSGEPTVRLLAIVREGLRLKLRALLQQALRDAAMASGETALTLGGTALRVEMSVTPLPPQGPHERLLVTFRSRPAPPPAAAHEVDELALRQLEDELQLTRSELQTAIEELESANEELRVANEEAMSMNEELHSANEELETSKEELQSLNEELNTVNGQMELKLREVEAANDDLTNLLTSTHMPTLFLDRRLRIKRFTPALSRLFNLIAADVERPITDIASRFPIGELLADVERVLGDLVPIEREMRSGDDHYLRRVLPYRTQDDRIEGVVVTFTDITELRRTTAELKQSVATARGQAVELDALYQSRPMGLALLDRELRCLRINPALAEIFGISAAQAVGQPLVQRLPWLGDALAPVMQRVVAGETLLNREVHSPPDASGATREWLVSLYPLKDAQGQVQSISAVVEETTERRLAQSEIQRGRVRLQHLLDAAHVGIAVAQKDGQLLQVNDELLHTLGYSRDDLRTAPLNWHALAPAGATLIGATTDKAASSRSALRLELALLRKDGSEVPVLVSATTLDGETDEQVAFVIDLTEAKRQRARLQAARDLTAQIERAREEDRARIAREIHDELGAALTAITMRFQAARSDASARRQPLPAALDAIPELIDGASQAINRIIGDLRPSVLDHLGVWAAIEWYATRVLPAAGIDYSIEVERSLRTRAIEADRATAIFRIVQEALTNVVRHSHAHQVAVRAGLDGGGALELEVHDDGTGIADHPSLDATAGGLMGMRERARRLGGELNVGAAPAGGTSVALRLPLQN